MDPRACCSANSRKIPDIATNARPEQIASIFRNCRLIGRRFRLAYPLFGRYIIEVATFARHRNAKPAPTATAPSSKTTTTALLEDDVVRRDFTINALYYDSKTTKSGDYVGALTTFEQPPHHPHHRDPVARVTPKTR